MRRGTEEDLKDLPSVIIGIGGGSWPEAEKAGLVSLGGMWMSPESAVKAREFYRKRNEETRDKMERREREGEARRSAAFPWGTRRRARSWRTN